MWLGTFARPDIGLSLTMDDVTMTHLPAGLPRWYAHRGARDWRCAAAPAEALAFHAGLPGYAATPLAEQPVLARELNVARLFVKDESARLGLPAFKALGACWAIAQVLAARAGLRGPLTLGALRAAAAGHDLTLVTATDGNHGRAVARFAAAIGLPAHVLVPQLIPAAAVAAIAAEGAMVTAVAGSYDDAVGQAARTAAADGTAVLVQDMAWPGYEEVPARIVEGYGTMPAEVDAQLASAGVAGPDLVVVPAGVGSLAQAIITHYRSRAGQHPAAVLCVEPEAAACVLASLEAGRPRSISTGATNMAGLNCGTPSSLAWPFLRDGLDAAVAVPDDAAARAVADLGDLGVSSGASGAAALAGARAALTGPGSDTRRAVLGVGADSVVVLLSTEGRPAARPARPPAEAR
jgi:diaminopropionate ammonia-lyase